MDERTVAAHIIQSVDKRRLLGLIKKWRDQSTESKEVDLLNDLRFQVLSGELDG